MSAPTVKGGASASPNILPFPQTARALRHYHTGMNAAGFLSLLLLDRNDEPLPPNVQRFDEPDGPTLPSSSPELLLALLIWETTSAKIKERIRCQLRGLAYAEHPNANAVRLLNLLYRRGK